MTDAFTKYAEAIAIPNKEAETVAMEIFINKELYFIPLYIKNKSENNKIEEIKSLVDTGAANSLIQYDIAKKLGLQFEPAKIQHMKKGVYNENQLICTFIVCLMAQRSF